MWNLLPQEEALNVKRLQKDAETLTDVTGGGVHTSTPCHPAKHRAPQQCWGEGEASVWRWEGWEQEGLTAQQEWKTGVRAPSDTGRWGQCCQKEMWDLEKEVSPAATPQWISGLKAKKPAHMGQVSPSSPHILFFLGESRGYLLKIMERWSYPAGWGAAEDVSFKRVKGRIQPLRIQPPGCVFSPWVAESWPQCKQNQWISELTGHLCPVGLLELKPHMVGWEMSGPFSTEGFQTFLPTEPHSRGTHIPEEDCEAMKPQERSLHPWARKAWEANQIDSLALPDRTQLQGADSC